jgi:hypothetical protein
MLGSTLKLALLAAVPPGVVTTIGPVVAPSGSSALIWLSLSATIVASAPPNWTPAALARLLPLTATVVPAAPELGENPEIFGAG